MADPHQSPPPPPPPPPSPAGPSGGKPATSGDDPEGPPAGLPSGPPMRAAPSGGVPGTGGPPLPPPPPPAAHGNDDGQGGRRTWWIVAAVVAALVLTPLVGILAFMRDDAPDAGPTEAAPEASEAPTGPAPSPSLTPDQPAPTPTPEATGPLGGDVPFEDLLGSDVLARCLVPPGMSPSLEGSPIPDEPADAIAAISDQVAQVRGLGFSSPVDLELLSDEALADRVITVSEEDYLVEDAALDDAILTTLGQMDADQDLRQVYLDLLGEQVAGFYDPETGELVAESASDLGPNDMMIIAHELDHALTDQALGLPDFEGMEDDVDGLLAQQGLVEGDATVLMQQWALGNLSLLDIAQLGTTPIDTTQLDAAPWALQAQLLYPYEAGLEFVCQLYVDGGWAAVDAAYTDLPTTSAQVLFPERYLAGEGAVEVSAPSTSEPGWEEARATTYGAAELEWLIEAPGNDRSRGLSDARERVADWAGGRQTVWQRDGDTMVSLDLVQHTGGDLCDTMRGWAEAAWPAATIVADDDTTTTWETSDGAVDLTCDGDMVQAVVGPDVTAVTSVG